jgi:hypothetical protein
MGRRSLLFLLSSAALTFHPAVVKAQQFSRAAVARDAETAFRAMMEAWAYDQHWRMWEMGTESSRMSISQNDFADRLRLSTIKPAAGKQVEAIQVDAQSATRAAVQARFSLEHHRQHRIRAFTLSTAAALEYDNWRFNLQDFLLLVRNQYWY